MRFLRTRRASEHYKWWVLTCTSLGMLLATINSGTLIIALPDLERSLHTTLLELVWVILVNKLFSAASGAAFINGPSRFALMFLFVFFFQGPQGQSPIMAGVELAPLAIGMLVASPIAGVIADRRGSRGLAALGMVVSAVGLAGMTMLQAHTAYAWSA